MLHFAFIQPRLPATAVAVGYRIASALAAWWHELRQRRRQRETAHLLHALSDRTLKDIGITRSEIDSIASAAEDDRRPRRAEFRRRVPR
jgi:uncharacterized protein YjiS (DUF1127 family)